MAQLYTEYILTMAGGVYYYDDDVHVTNEEIRAQEFKQFTKGRAFKAGSSHLPVITTYYSTFPTFDCI